MCLSLQIFTDYIANTFYDYASIRFNRSKMFQFCERKSTFSFKHKVIFTDKVLRYFKIDIGIIKIPRLYIFFYFTRLATVLVDALPGDPDLTPSMGEMTWSPAELVVQEYEGAACRRITASTSDSFISMAAAGNGRCVEVSNARIGRGQDRWHPQPLGFRGKLESDALRSIRVPASGRMVTVQQLANVVGPPPAF